MTKYMIQDIVPNEKKHSQRGIKKTQTTRREPDTRNTVATDATTLRSHEYDERRSSARETEHIAEHKQIDTETEIEDLLPENPRAMILDHLYEDAHHSTDRQHPGASQTSASIEPLEIHHPAVKGESVRTPNDAPDTRRRIFPQFPTYRGDPGSGKSSWIPWIIIPCIFLLIAFFVFNHFARADVLIIPKHNNFPFDSAQQLTALKTPAPNELGFSVMNIALDDSVEVSATGTKTVTAKASGVIVVYNEQAVPQRLIKNTRFQSTAGKIYRINDSIVVPKQVAPKGAKPTPGSIEVTIYADDAGPDYNSSPTDFTLPGLKNLPQYSKVYARSKSAVSGGASGTTKSVSDQTLRQASDDLRVSLETKLRSKVRTDMSPTQIGYDQSILVRLENPTLSTTTTSNEHTALVTLHGTLSIVVFDRTALVKAIARLLIPTYSNEDIAVTNLDSLVFAMQEQNIDALLKADKLEFSLSGTPEIVWVVNEDAVKKSLVGISKSNFNTTMSQFTTIERANASLRPFWKSAYPQDLSAIHIKIVKNIGDE